MAQHKMTFEVENGLTKAKIDGVYMGGGKAAQAEASEEQIKDVVEDTVKANPEMVGDEPNLEGLELSGDKYTIKTYFHNITISKQNTTNRCIINFIIPTNSKQKITTALQLYDTLFNYLGSAYISGGDNTEYSIPCTGFHYTFFSQIETFSVSTQFCCETKSSSSVAFLDYGYDLLNNSGIGKWSRMSLDYDSVIIDKVI